VALGLNGQDPGDLALCDRDARRVLERAGRHLKAQVEQVLAAVGQAPIQLFVRQLS
jgi:hypothetical protein